LNQKPHGYVKGFANAFRPSLSTPGLSRYVFDGKQHFDIGDVAGLFISLSADYRKISGGRKLVLIRLEIGSLFAALQDAVVAATPYARSALETAKAAKFISILVQYIRKLIVTAQTKETRAPEFSDKKCVGVKSVEAIAKMAIKSKSNLKIKYLSAEGDNIEIDLSPVQAVHLQEVIRADRAHTQDCKSVTFSKSRDDMSLSDLNLTKSRAQIADRLVQLTGPDSSGRRQTHSQVAKLVASVIENLLELGMNSTIEFVAYDLDSRELHDLAATVRKQLEQSLRDR